MPNCTNEQIALRFAMADAAAPAPAAPAAEAPAAEAPAAAADGEAGGSDGVGGGSDAAAGASTKGKSGGRRRGRSKKGAGVAPEASFLTRQGAHAVASAERATAAAAALAAVETTPDLPAKDQTLALLAAGSPRHAQRLSETAAERVKRLSVTEAAEHAAALAALAEEERKRAGPFAPTLSPATVKLCPKGADVAELHSDTRGAKARAAAEERAKASAPSFRPNTAPSRASRRLHAEASALPRVGCSTSRIKALQEVRVAARACVPRARLRLRARARRTCFRRACRGLGPSVVPVRACLAPRAGRPDRGRSRRAPRCGARVGGRLPAARRIRACPWACC
jgi:hypothetical protein